MGQQSVLALKRFGVNVVAIEQAALSRYEVPEFPHLLDRLITGDCAYEPVLDQLDWAGCRAAIMATSVDQTNIETALLIRQRNHRTRLVVRSGQENLNQLLSEQLGNLIAYDPLELPAHAYALAALGSDTLGFFKLDGQWLHVLSLRLHAHHPWLNQFRLDQVNSKTRSILAHRRGQGQWFSPFFQGDYQGEGAYFSPEDEVVYIELVDQRSLETLTRSPMEKAMVSPLDQGDGARPKLWQRWRQKLWHQPPLALGRWLGDRPVIMLAGLLIFLLCLAGTLLLYNSLPENNLASAFYQTVVLLLGGYGDMFEILDRADESNWLVQPISILLTLAGTASVGIIYALVTENLLAERFRLLPKQVEIPRANHVIIVGFGRLGQKIAKILQEWRQSFVCVTLERSGLPLDYDDLPLVAEPLPGCLTSAHLNQAQSVLAVTGKDLVNLEVALLAKKINPAADLIIRTNKIGLSRGLVGLLPGAQILDIYRLAAQVFVGAAFGENIINLFQLHQNTILVTEYRIEKGDTLTGLLISETAHGYGVIPVLYQSFEQGEPVYFPSYDIILHPGDRLVVLATIEGLRKIENRDLLAKTWHLTIESVRNQDAAFEGANILSRISGCSLKQARQAMKHPPYTLPTRLYHPQARRLTNSLKRCQIEVSLHQ